MVHRDHNTVLYHLNNQPRIKQLPRPALSSLSLSLELNSPLLARRRTAQAQSEVRARRCASGEPGVENIQNLVDEICAEYNITLVTSPE